MKRNQTEFLKLCLADALIKLGVPHDVALQDACKMEHDLSDVTVSCIKSFLKKD